MKLPPLSPEKASTRTEIRVRFCETDLMGIVHHAQYLAYFEVGRVEWLRRRGITYSSWVARDIHLPVVDVALRYRAPARFDDVLVVETRLACVDGSHVLSRIPPDVFSVLSDGELASPSPHGAT